MSEAENIEERQSIYYMQFSYKVLEIMKDARCALTHSEYEMFIESIQKLIKEEIRI